MRAHERRRFLDALGDEDRVRPYDNRLPNQTSGPSRSRARRPETPSWKTISLLTAIEDVLRRVARGGDSQRGAYGDRAAS
jgi:hypothetical protein